MCSLLTCGLATSLVQQKKERNRLSLNRVFVGDYISSMDNPGLKSLLGSFDSDSRGLNIDLD